MTRTRKRTGVRPNPSEPRQAPMSSEVQRAGRPRSAPGEPTVIVMPPLHARQEEIRLHPARFKVIANGRRFGKTRLAVALTFECAVNGGRAWWIAPTYAMTLPGWRLLQALALQVPGAQIHRSDRYISFASGGEVWAKTGDDPDALRGEGLDLVVLDECAFMVERVWNEAIRPALADRNGRGIFISSPQGRNWFWRLWSYAASEQDPEWKAFRFSSYENPFLNPSELDAAKKTMPERIYSQEILAQFLEDSGIVFRNVRQCVRAVMQAARSKEQKEQSTAETRNLVSDLGTSPEALPYPFDEFSFVMGLDWAQKNDFTVDYVGCTETHEVVDGDRFNQIDFAFQRERIKEKVEQWHVSFVLAESNAIGSPNIEALQNDGINVFGFETTNKSKDELIRALALAFEKQDIWIPEDEGLIAELEAYEVKRLPSGKWQYSAPEGMFDDRVIALALTYKAMNDGSVLVDFLSDEVAPKAARVDV